MGFLSYNMIGLLFSLSSRTDYLSCHLHVDTDHVESGSGGELNKTL